MNEKPIINRSADFKRFLRQLEELLKPKYQACCIHCGKSTEISQELVRRIITNESRRSRLKARG